jgi:hypothetical protein
MTLMVVPNKLILMGWVILWVLKVILLVMFIEYLGIFTFKLLVEEHLVVFLLLKFVPGKLVSDECLVF